MKISRCKARIWLPSTTTLGLVITKEVEVELETTTLDFAPSFFSSIPSDKQGISGLKDASGTFEGTFD